MSELLQSIVMLAMLGQVLLIFALYVRMFKLRVDHAKSNRKTISLKRVALGQEPWPDHVVQNEAALKNQFEAPVLFFAVCILAIATNLISVLFAGLAILFLVFRIWHAQIHTGQNQLGPRIKAFSCSLFTVVAMWLLLVGHQLYRQIIT
ncbi:MAG: MAPEG family protein [Hyphomicrobiales bacterium]